MTATYRLDFYHPWQDTGGEPAKTSTVAGLELSTILVKGDEWRELTGGTMTYTPVPTEPPARPAPYIDAAGVAHQVDITTAYHDYWTASGELLADCLCGWWDHHPYRPGGADYAGMKLCLRAIGHVT